MIFRLFSGAAILTRKNTVYKAIGAKYTSKAIYVFLWKFSEKKWIGRQHTINSVKKLHFSEISEIFGETQVQGSGWQKQGLYTLRAHECTERAHSAPAPVKRVFRCANWPKWQHFVQKKISPNFRGAILKYEEQQKYTKIPILHTSNLPSKVLF